MKVVRRDLAEESMPLIKHKGNEERDITAEDCPYCGRSVQVIKGKMKKHKCLDGVK